MVIQDYTSFLAAIENVFLIKPNASPFIAVDLKLKNIAKLA